MKATHLFKPTKKLAITVTYLENGEERQGVLNIEHRVITPEIWAGIRAGTATEDAQEPAADAGEEAPAPLPAPKQTAAEVLEKDSLIKELLMFLVSWDVEDENGPLPITRENLALMDYKVLKEISTAVFQYTFPNWMT